MLQEINITIPRYIIHKSKLSKEVRKKPIHDINLEDLIHCKEPVLAIKQVQVSDAIAIVDDDFGVLLQCEWESSDEYLHRMVDKESVIDYIECNKREYSFYE